MTDFLFPPAPIPSLPIRGSDKRFPVRRIYCVGRNYADHAIEMGHDPDREPPFFFQKNPDNIVTPDADGPKAGIAHFPYPGATSDVHFEIELVVALVEGGRDIPASEAMGKVFGACVGLDMTRRDLQAQQKKAGRPWEIAKAFEHSAPMSALVPLADGVSVEKGAITLDVNGTRRQTGDLSQMIWKVPEAISCLSTLFTLAPGDLIMTGTPAGVGPCLKGDTLRGAIEGLGELVCEVG